MRKKKSVRVNEKEEKDFIWVAASLTKQKRLCDLMRERDCEKELCWEEDRETCEKERVCVWERERCRDRATERLSARMREWECHFQFSFWGPSHPLHLRSLPRRLGDGWIVVIAVVVVTVVVVVVAVAIVAIVDGPQLEGGSNSFAKNWKGGTENWSPSLYSNLPNMLLGMACIKNAPTYYIDPPCFAHSCTYRHPSEAAGPLGIALSTQY